MNPIDRLVTALTLGSIFNKNAKIFRSIASLSVLAGISEDEVLEILNGDLAGQVTCKPSTKGKGILAALTANVVIEANAAPVQEMALPGEPVPENAPEEVDAPAAVPLPEGAADAIDGPMVEVPEVA